MPPRLTIEHVTRKFSERGFTLLSNKYDNGDTPLDYICDYGHTTTIRYNKFRKGQGCAECSGNKRLTIKLVKENFALKGFNLYEKEYINNRTPMKCLCSNGHKNSVSWANFQQDSFRCPYCVRSRISISQIYEEFKERKYELISTNYKNNKSVLEFKCDKGHNTSIIYSGFQKGSGCKICSTEKSRNDFEDVKKLFIEKEYTLLDTEYTSCDKKLKYKCSEGHHTSISYSKLRVGKGCKQCIVNKSKNKYKYIYNFFQKEGFILLENVYINNISKMKYKCPKGHISSTTFNSFQRGNRCPMCCNWKNETRCREILEKWFCCSFPKLRPQWLKGLELDGYNEELGIAFEYNGQQHYEYVEFFHRDINKLYKQQENDAKKIYLCGKNNVTLIVIPYTVEYNHLEEYILNIFN